MNTTWDVICSAIKSSLFDMDVSLPENIDWDDVFSESKKQAIVSLVRAGVKNQFPQSLSTTWKLSSIQEISHGVQLMEAQNDICSLIEAQDIKYCILKGTAAAIYYPEPFFRSMGDVDFWVHESQFDLCLDLLLKNGYVEINGCDTRHLKMIKDNILFEMHRYFASVESDKPVDKCIEQADLIRGQIGEYSFRMLPELENGLVLLVHLRQHLFEGLGLRQILDWMMYCAKNLDEEGWNRFRPMAQELGLEKLAMVTTWLCCKHFGLQVNWAEEDDNTAALLLNNIIQSGNFGKAHGDGRNVERVFVNIKKHGLFHYLQKAGEFNWKVLRTRPYLKPFAWVYQICRYFRQTETTGRMGVKLKDDVQRSNERYELLKRLGLI